MFFVLFVCVCWCFKPQYYLFICIFNSKSNGGRNVFLMLGNSNVPVRTHSWGFTACPAAVYVKNKQTDSDLVETYSACSVLYWALWLFGGWAANFLRLLKHFHLWMHRFYFFPENDFFDYFFFFFFQHYWEFSVQLSLQLLRSSTGLNCSTGSFISSRHNLLNHVKTNNLPPLFCNSPKLMISFFCCCCCCFYLAVSFFLV